MLTEQKVVRETTKILSTAARKRGFTLVELSVVIVVLVLFATLILPNLCKQKSVLADRDFYPGVQRIVSYAREQAIGQNITTVVTFDEASNSFTVGHETFTDQNEPTDSNITNQPGSLTSVTSTTPPATNPNATTTNSATSANVTISNDTVSMTVPMPTTYSIADYQIAGSDKSASDWQLEFFPDGHCDGGLLHFRHGSLEDSVVINTRGKSKIVEGNIPDPTADLWPAGQLAVRQ